MAPRNINATCLLVRSMIAIRRLQSRFGDGSIVELFIGRPNVDQVILPRMILFLAYLEPKWLLPCIINDVAFT